MDKTKGIILSFLFFVGMGAIIIAMIPSMACQMHVHAGAGGGGSGGGNERHHGCSCGHEGYSIHHHSNGESFTYDDYNGVWVKKCEGKDCYHNGDYAYGNGAYGNSKYVYQKRGGKWVRVKNHY